MQSAVSPNDRRVLLASQSPRRRALLEQVGIEPVVRVSNVEEIRAEGETPTKYTLRLALSKARAVAVDVVGDDSMPRFILSADTIVTLDDAILEKPADEEDAVRMLTALSGRTHSVVTAYCWLDREGAAICDHVVAQVSFRALDAGEIERYVATGEPMDKAGAYGIQGIGGAFVTGLEGSYTAVVGLPIARVLMTLSSIKGLEDFPFPTK